MSSPGAGARVVTLPRVVSAEWTKLAGLPWPGWLVAGTVASAVALTAVSALLAGPGGAGVAVVGAGTVPAQLGVLVLGVVVGAGEFSTGTSLTTFAAVPRRWPVLVAQTVVTAAVALVTAVVALAASVPVAAGAGWDAADPGAVRAAAGYVLLLTGVAVLGLGLGSLLRRPAAALTTGVVLLVLVDGFLAANPGRVADTARALLPGSGGRLVADDAELAALAAGPGPDLGAGTGALVLVGWCAGVLLLAGHRLRSRDVT
ncbi:hypothetical protein [Kineococcus sp. SYSU DK002]|uniref:hypothetical protein n=1 Tax=Kineococcus sp. SYSU DK002 TaxID=3383123 RepID=UPI003D7C7196